MSEMRTPDSGSVRYDINEGKLLIGASAIDDAIEAGYDSTDMYELADLLDQPKIMVGPDFTDPMEYSDWDSADDIPVVKWLHGLIRDAREGRKAAISHAALTRAGYLGITPRITYFSNRPGGVQGMYAEAELRDVKMRGYFDTWANQDFVDYVQELGRELGRKPQHNDFVEHARIAGNPSDYHMEQRFGKPSTLLELAGWVNVKEWSTNDFIDWGVHFMFVNNGLLPTSRHLRYVSAYSRGIGPGTDAIYDEEGFTSIMDFQTKVADEYSRQSLFQQQVEKLLLEQSQLDADSDPLVRGLVDSSEGSEELLQMYAKFVLVSALLPELGPSEQKSLCRMKKPIHFAERVLRLDPRIKLADVETMAASLGVTHIVWAQDHTKDPLRVANWPEEWAEEFKSKNLD